MIQDFYNELLAHFLLLLFGSAGGKYCDEDWQCYRLWQATGQESLSVILDIMNLVITKDLH